MTTETIARGDAFLLDYGDGGAEEAPDTSGNAAVAWSQGLSTIEDIWRGAGVEQIRIGARLAAHYALLAMERVEAVRERSGARLRYS